MAVKIEYSDEELKVMIAEVLAAKLYTSLPKSTRDEIMRKAKDRAIERLAYNIGEEMAIV